MKYTTFEKLEQELASRDAEIESMRQQLDGWIAANSPNGWIDNLRQQLVTLKTELKSIGEAIDDPRTDLTMTMSEVIVEQKQQHAAALAACKAKDDIILEVLECASTTRPPVRLREALAIQPDDSALKAWLGEPVAYVDDAGCCWMAKLGRQNGKPLYARKEQK